MRSFILAAGLCFALTLVACDEKSAVGPGADVDEPLPGRTLAELTQNERSILAAGNSFAFGLFREVASEEPDGNLVLSPFSVTVALAMTSNATSDAVQQSTMSALGFEGYTQEEVNRTIGDVIAIFEESKDVTIRSAQSIWVDDDITPQAEFLDVCQADYDAEIFRLDFQDPNTYKVINKWASEHTNGLIDPFLSGPLDPMTVAALLNALYFHGDWAIEFDEDMTYVDDFHHGDCTKDAWFMYRRDDILYAENERMQAVSLAYKGGPLRLAVLLPKGETTVSDVEAEFDKDEWDALRASFWLEAVNLFLPRFTVKPDKMYELAPALARLGFDNLLGAALSGLCRRCSVSNVIQKTYMRVDEKGTEAAAVTAVLVDVSAAADEPKSFYANRPFHVLLYEQQAGAVLFMGRIVDPESAEGSDWVCE